MEISPFGPQSTFEGLLQRKRASPQPAGERHADGGDGRNA
jgi:hypothetical protein